MLALVMKRHGTQELDEVNQWQIMLALVIERQRIENSNPTTTRHVPGCSCRCLSSLSSFLEKCANTLHSSVITTKLHTAYTNDGKPCPCHD